LHNGEAKKAAFAKEAQQSVCVYRQKSSNQLKPQEVLSNASTTDNKESFTEIT